MLSLFLNSAHIQTVLDHNRNVKDVTFLIYELHFHINDTVNALKHKTSCKYVLYVKTLCLIIKTPFLSSSSLFV